MIRHLGDRLNRIIPDFGIIGLKGIIEPILPHPKRHQRSAEFCQSIQARLGFINRSAAHRWIWIGKRAQLEARIGIIAHGQTVQRDLLILKQML